MNGGQQDNESFGGPGDDFILAGAGTEDAVLGDGGDDWLQGGPGSDLLQGDHADFFFLDPGEFEPGNDVLVGQPNDNDYDTEGGDDVMAATTAIEKYVGSGGWDWAIHQYSPIAANDDMRLNALLDLAQPVVVNRDRWQETEAVSGSGFNDVIKGDDLVPSTLGGAGFTGCDVLDQAGLNRIPGLGAIVPPLTGSLQTVVDNSAAGECPLSGPIWGEGNILIGGGGSDTITGRGGDDIIDGDRQLTVRISVRAPGTGPLASRPEIGSTDLMEKQFARDPITNALTGPTLMAAVAAGTVNPADLLVTREITIPTNPGSDTAVFTANLADYTMNINANGRIVVTQNTLAPGQRISDGTDILRNIEKVQFADQTVNILVPNAPTNVVATAISAATATGSANLTWTRAVPNGGPPILSQEIVITPVGGTPLPPITGIAANATQRLGIGGLVNGQAYTFQVRAVNDLGAGPLSAPSAPVTPRGLPAAPRIGTAVRGNAQATVNWTAGGDGGAPISNYRIQVRVGGVVQRTVDTPGPETSFIVTGLTNGTAYTFRVQARNTLFPATFGALSAASNAVTPATVPNPPTIVSVTGGVTTDAAVNATIVWNPPANTGGLAITSYTLRVVQLQADQVTPVDGGTRTITGIGTGVNARNRTVGQLVAGAPYRFEVMAVNALGASAPAISTVVIAN
jgi:hypothetical protein